MAQTIKIKRSSSNSTPTSLASGELAYSFKADSKKLFIGDELIPSSAYSHAFLKTFVG